MINHVVAVNFIFNEEVLRKKTMDRRPGNEKNKVSKENKMLSPK